MTGRQLYAAPPTDENDGVVVLHTRTLADRGGGPEKTILASPAHYRATPYRLIAAYMHPPGSPGFADLARAARERDCEIIGIPDRGPLDPRPVAALLRLCRERRVAVWHAHDYKSNAIGILLRRFHPMRLITTLHGWSDVTTRTRLYFAIDRLCLRGYDHVFAVSDDLADAARRSAVPPHRLSMLRNGVDPSHFRRRGPAAQAAMRRDLSVAERRYVVATVGRLAASKGLDTVLEAFASAARGGREVELWVTGDGPERAPLEARAAQLGIAASVRFLGFQEDVRPVLEASDLLVSASLREGTPNTILEALAMEVPVVVTDIAGVRELIRDGHNGLMYALGNARALAAAMSRLLDDDALRQRLRHAGRRQVESDLTLASRMRGERAVYDRLLASSQP